MHVSDGKERKLSIFSIALLIAGIVGMFVAASYDLLRAGGTNFGTKQLAGFVVAAFVAVAGLRRAALSNRRLWDGLLLAAYLAGIFYMGLRFQDRHFYRRHVHGALQNMSFVPGDVLINLVGFVPLGYLMASFLLTGRQTGKTGRDLILATGLCALVSFVIEYVQFYLPGRTSSIVDLTVNTVGALIGVCVCLLERRLTRDS